MSEHLESKKEFERLRRVKDKEKKEKGGTKKVQTENKAKIEAIKEERYSASIKKKEISNFEIKGTREFKAPSPLFYFDNDYKSCLKAKEFLDIIEKDAKRPSKVVPKFGAFEKHKSLTEIKNVDEFAYKKGDSHIIGIPVIQFSPYKSEIKVTINEVIEVTYGKNKEEITALEASGGEVKEELELPNFFELLLGKGAGKISEGKPICIIVPETKENYEELIAVLCRDIYREKIGGKPKPIYRETIEELRREFESLVERRIIVVKKAKRDSKDLLQILDGFFSQDMGFLILVSSEPLKLENDIRKKGERSANIIMANPQPEMEIIRDELLKIVRGKKAIIQAESFGEEFKKSAEDFERELIKEYLNPDKAPEKLRYDWDRLIASSSDVDEEASPIHSAMKAFVWMYEWKKYKKRIIPELEKEEKDRIVDVKIRDKNYEIETLFEAGDVYGKLVSKIKNYDEKGKVYFVLRNLDILRNLSLFLRFKNDWRNAGYLVEFFGLDLDKQTLIPLEKFKEFVKSMVKK